MTNIKQALSQAITLLSGTSPTAQIDAEILLAHILDTSRTSLYTHPEKILSQAQNTSYQEFIIKRSAGFPVAYLTQHREFWSLPLLVSNDTLIPRPETELLVELCLTLLKTVSNASILDLGTGSGAIALAIASERPDWRILACDKNQDAVEIANYNANNLKIPNIKICQSDWFTSIPKQRFNAIISNPPYIAKNDPHLWQGDVQFEPREALISGEHGLDDLTYLIDKSYEYLLPDGLLLLEHGFDQGSAVTSLLQKRGYSHVKCWQDWQRLDRVSGGWSH